MVLLKKILLSLLAILLIIEEWLWDSLTALGHALSRLLHLQRFEQWLEKTNPKVALLAFAIPLLVVAPINLVAFWMIAHGHIMQGIMVEIAAKLLGTLLVARVFALTRKQLMSFRWFAFITQKILGWISWAHARVSSTAVYKLAKRTKSKIKKWLA